MSKAKLLLITTPITIISKAIVAKAKKLNPNIHIIARAEGIEEMQVLHDAGVSHVVQPAFEAGLEFARQALLHLNIPARKDRTIYGRGAPVNYIGLSILQPRLT